MSTAGTIKHRAILTGVDNPAFQASKNAWNDSLTIAGAAPDGALMIRDRAHPDGFGHQEKRELDVRDAGTFAPGADHSALLQAWFDEAQSTSQVLRGFPGIYHVETTLIWNPDDVVSKGPNFDGHTMLGMVFDNHVANGPLIDLYCPTNFRFMYGGHLGGFKIITTTSEANSIGIRVKNGWLCQISNVYIEGLTGDAIQISGIATDDGDGTSNLAILNCVLLDNGGWGVHDSHASGSISTGFLLLEGNRITLNGAGGVKWAGLIGRFEANTIAYNLGIGIHVPYNNIHPQNVNIINNEFDSNLGHHIRIDACLGGRILNNQWTGLYGVGLPVTDISCQVGDDTGVHVARCIEVKGNRVRLGDGTSTAAHTVVKLTSQAQYCDAKKQIYQIETTNTTRIDNQGVRTHIEDDGHDWPSPESFLSTTISGAGTFTPDLERVAAHRVSIATVAAVEIAIPTGADEGSVMYLDIANNSGGTSAVTLHADYQHNGWTQPKNGEHRTAIFLLSSNSQWVQLGGWWGMIRTTGTENLFIGVGAGNDLVSGVGKNTAIGFQAGLLLTTGTGNTLVGRTAGAGLTSGYGNTFTGVGAGTVSADGFYNCFYGQGAGASTTTGNQNCFYGTLSGLSNTTGVNNTCFGQASGELNVNGIGNVFVGRNAGRPNVSGNFGVCLGQDAGLLNTSADYNTFVGYSAGLLDTTQYTRSTAIGQSALVGASNALILGGSGATNYVNVGIGLSAPAYKLDVVGQTCLFGADNINDVLRTSAVSKTMRLWMPHYTAGEEPVWVIGALGSSLVNTVYIGGSAAAANAATRIEFWTAPTITTTTGTLRCVVTDAGLSLQGSTSGAVTLGVAATAGTWAMTLPTTAGTSGYVLSTNGSGVTSWVAQMAGGDVVGPSSSTNNALARFSNTTGKLIASDARLTFDPATADFAILFPADWTGNALWMSQSSGLYVQGPGVYYAENVSVANAGTMTVTADNTVGTLATVTGIYSLARTATASPIVFGALTRAQSVGPGSATTEIFGTYNQAIVSGTGTIRAAFGNNSIVTLEDTAVTGTAFGYYADFNKAAGATANAIVSYWATDLAGSTKSLAPYYLWFDSRGVYRVREDTVADGAGNPQAVATLYNPRFTKYEANAANYERGTPGQWVNNIWYVTTEAAGTGVLRDLAIVGSGLIFSPAAGQRVSQRNGTNAQRFDLANTFTSTSVREDLSLSFASNIAHIGTTHTGATARVLQFDYGGTTTAALSIPITSGDIVFGGGITLPDAGNITFNATTGTKIGTATTQKFAFYNATPIVQGASVADATDAASAITQLNALISRIEATGLIATV